MDEQALNDLLECSVCLERFDTSSKTLPCQHTFCKKCLINIAQARKELRCPECRVVVKTPIDELPTNVLLMRLLDGMRNTAAKTAAKQTTPTVSACFSSEQQMCNGELPSVAGSNWSPQHPPDLRPSGFAIFDYTSPDNSIAVKTGDLVFLKKSIDSKWVLGECKGKQGPIPLSNLRILTPLSANIVPQCRALYDFPMRDDEDTCLNFARGDVITVIRRVDENWAEGRLHDNVGIFPLSYVELNDIAKTLIKTRSRQPSNQTLAVPSTPAEPHVQQPVKMRKVFISNAAVTACRNRAQAMAVENPVRNDVNNETTERTGASLNEAFENSASSSTTTPNTSYSTSSSSASTAPSSPSMDRHVENKPANSEAVSKPVESNGRASFGGGMVTRVPTKLAAAECNAKKNLLPARHKRSASADIAISFQLVPRGQKEATRQRSSESLHYVAVYPYKPKKPDELELKKNTVYIVTERCQDGWYKGMSTHTFKSGVFPGNYVVAMPHSKVPKTRSTFYPDLSLYGGPSTSRHASGAAKNDGLLSMSMLNSPNHTSKSKMTETTKLFAMHHGSKPPKLPPRSGSPTTTSTSISTSWHGAQSNAAICPLGRSASASITAFKTPQQQSPINTKDTKNKERTMGVMMKRLASIKRSSVAHPTDYSMDNPVFEHHTPLLTALTSNLQAVNLSSAPSGPRPVTHVRSASSPVSNASAASTSTKVSSGQTKAITFAHFTDQLTRTNSLRPSKCSNTTNTNIKKKSSTRSAALHDATAAAVVASRLRNTAELKDRDTSGSRLTPEITPNVTDTPTKSTYKQLETSFTSHHHHHRKSHSMDAGQPTLTVPRARNKPDANVEIFGERFRCVVPYPPNTDAELELRVDDIIFALKRREDGWCKGFQVRTGRTGLFPVSFVESIS